ncbi:hypothetical protein [Prosthecobacter sp.]|nr:hypothetical protein [Prosthecobacter sp.]MDI1312639.1 hypothetical protein [Prosthecobacter sp.]
MRRFAVLKVDLKRVGLFGFSQGAVVAADLATLYPNSKPNAQRGRPP